MISVQKLVDQILFFMFFVVFFGFVYLVYYYQEFGVRVVDISFDANHIAYRGISLLGKELSFFLIYMIAVILILLLRINFILKIRRLSINRDYLVVPAMLIVFFVGWIEAIDRAVKDASSDMYLESTSLQEILVFHSADADKSKFFQSLKDRGRKILILRQHQSKLVLFVAPSIKAKRPKIPLYHVGLSSGDYYSHNSPIERLR
ncbi:hypothetical protein K1718_10370 [Roseibium porphyridii]|uniref:Uncharacterized protein n=1 Tax=Roseibium porphyridii TaxID=2866279 RepID=A0ABY8F8L7_9HYPH|nr:hypothetical protein [Roseibium sp. KMA01]WFE91739.1 hypothetical protein K1718_10370 [Roseibium sp. KMA01]